MTDEERKKLCELLRDDDIDCFHTKRCWDAADEIERLARERDETIKSSDAVCDSYAKENQRLSDKIERLASVVKDKNHHIKSLEAEVRNVRDVLERLKPR